MAAAAVVVALDESHKQRAWFRPTLTRALAEQVAAAAAAAAAVAAAAAGGDERDARRQELSGQPVKAFVVRPASLPDCFSLSHVEPDGRIGHGARRRRQRTGLA